MDRVKIASKSYVYGRNISTLDNTISSIKLNTLSNLNAFGIRICLRKITN